MGRRVAGVALRLRVGAALLGGCLTIPSGLSITTTVPNGAPDRWARELVGRGYVALVPDSFTTRGFAKDVCPDPSPPPRRWPRW